jgi:hypothetical protein
MPWSLALADLKLEVQLTKDMLIGDHAIDTHDLETTFLILLMRMNIRQVTSLFEYNVPLILDHIGHSVTKQAVELVYRCVRH